MRSPAQQPEPGNAFYQRCKFVTTLTVLKINRSDLLRQVILPK
ncbi:hypothetical protein [Spirosoma profusum]|nr:hypothetical protein [Spirosoma profusum]